LKEKLKMIDDNHQIRQHKIFRWMLVILLATGLRGTIGVGKKVSLAEIPIAVSQENLKISPNPDGGTTEENDAPKEHALDTGLIFQLSTLNDEIFARDAEGQQINWLEATPRGFARRNAFGALDVSAGGYVIGQVGSLIAGHLERTQAFTLMASVTCFDGGITDETRIISLSVGGKGIKLVQRGSQIMFRTEGVKGNRVCEALPGKRTLPQFN